MVKIIRMLSIVALILSVSGCGKEEEAVFEELEEFEWGELVSDHLREIGVEEVDKILPMPTTLYTDEEIVIFTPERKLTVYLSGTDIPVVKGSKIEWEVLYIHEFPKYFYKAPVLEQDDLYDYRTGEPIVTE